MLYPRSKENIGGVEKKQKSELYSHCFMFCGLGLLAFYFLSITSFSPYDNSWLSYGYPLETPKNQGGLLGAWVSGTALYHFGLTAFLLPVPFLFFVIQKLTPKNKKTRYIKYFLLASWALVFISFISTEFLPIVLYGKIPFASSGMLGEMIHKNMLQLFGRSGSYLLLVFSTLSILSLYFKGNQLRFIISKSLFFLKKIKKTKTDSINNKKATKASQHREPLIMTEPTKEKQDKKNIKEKIFHQTKRP